MKIKLDENLPVELAVFLILANHDVHTVPQESLTGRDDAVVLQTAGDEGRMLITQDLDFSDIRRFAPGTHPGIVLVRLRDPCRRLLIARIRQAFLSEDIKTWAGCFVVIGDHRLRIRRP